MKYQFAIKILFGPVDHSHISPEFTSTIVPFLQTVYAVKFLYCVSLAIKDMVVKATVGTLALIRQSKDWRKALPELV